MPETKSVKTKLLLATRGSKLARVQTERAQKELMNAGAVEVAMHIVETKGDSDQTSLLSTTATVGWFTQAIESELIAHRADIAVHSAKDLPSIQPESLGIAALLKRDAVEDVLVLRFGESLKTLGEKWTLGTSSPRRKAFASQHFPQSTVVSMRGNVDTRLHKLDTGEVDALILAGAGLERLGLHSRISVRLDPMTFVPAPAQGIIALEAEKNSRGWEWATKLNDASAYAVFTAERAVLVACGGGCFIPLGAWARVHDSGISIVASFADADGTIRTDSIDGLVDDAQSLGTVLGKKLIAS